MLAIKLSQKGKTNKKVFRIVISEKSKDPFGDVLEILGSYNPHSKELVAKSERINYWLSKGAQMTPTVNNLLVGKEIIDGDKVKASKKGTKSEKREAQLTAKAEKNKKATEEEKPAETKEEEPAAETAEPTEKASEEKAE